MEAKNLNLNDFGEKAKLEVRDGKGKTEPRIFLQNCQNKQSQGSFYKTVKINRAKDLFKNGGKKEKI